MVGIALQAPSGDAAWFGDVEVGAFRDDNLTRAQAKADRRDDRAFAARAWIGRRIALSGYEHTRAGEGIEYRDRIVNLTFAHRLLR